MRVLFFLSLFAFVASCSKSESNCFGFTEKDVTFAQELTTGVWINSDTIGDIPGRGIATKYVCTLDSTKYESISWSVNNMVVSRYWRFQGYGVPLKTDVIEVLIKGNCNGKQEEAKVTFKPVIIVPPTSGHSTIDPSINPDPNSSTSQPYPVWGRYNGYEASNSNQNIDISLYDSEIGLSSGLASLGRFNLQAASIYSLPTAAYIKSSSWGSDGSVELMARLYKKDSILVDVSFFEGGSLKYKRFRGKRQ
jgi:hypothetical protein